MVRLSEWPLVRVLLVAFALWILLQLIQQSLWVLVLVLLAVILATAMMPIVRFCQQYRLPPGRWRIPSAVIVVIIYILLGWVVALMAFFVGEALFSELMRLIESIPAIVAAVVNFLEGLEQQFGVSGLVPSEEVVSDYFQQVATNIAEAIRIAGLFLEGIANFLFQLFLVLALALFMVIESDQILGFWVGLFPSRDRDRVRELTTQAGHKIGRWLLGQILIATIVGLLAGVAAWILGLPYPILVAVVTGVLDLAPVIGPTLMIPVVFLLGLNQSLVIAIVAAIVFLGISEFNAHVLSPLITGQAVRISLTLVLIAVPLGLALYGPIGALIAIPVTATLQLLTHEIFLPWLHREENAQPHE